MSEDSPQPVSRRERLWRAAEARKIPLGTILVTVAVVGGTYVLARLAYRLRDVLLLIIVAGFIALVLNPLVVALQRLGIRRRGLAVAVVTLLAVVVFAGLAVAFGLPLVDGITHLADDLPGYVSAAEHGRGWIGTEVRRYHVQRWIVSNAPKLASFGKDLTGPALSLGKGAFSLVIALVTIFILTTLLLLEGPKIRTGLLALLPRDRADRYSAVAREVNRSVTGYMLGNLLTSLIAGCVVLVTLTLLDVPFAPLWALWVALVDFLPMIGGALAGIPTVLFAFFSGLTPGIVTLVVFVVYTQVENHVLNPVIMSRTVKVNPLLVLLAILVGASVGNWVGGDFGAFVAALLSIPAAGALQVLVREIWRETGSQPLPDARQPSATGTESDGAQPRGTDLDGTDLDGTDLDGTEPNGAEPNGAEQHAPGRHTPEAAPAEAGRSG